VYTVCLLSNISVITDRVFISVRQLLTADHRSQTLKA
jgi:hypothetical protein